MGEIAEARNVIYRISSAVTSRSYIGSTILLSQRRRQHLYSLRKGKHYNRHLQRTFNKYGETDLVFSIIEGGIDPAHLIDREAFYITTMKPAFNADMPWPTRRGAKQSEACKEKLRKANTGRKLPAAELIRRSARMLGNRNADGNQNATKVTPTIFDEIMRLKADGLGCRRIARAVCLNKKTIQNVFNNRHSYGATNG